jgi:hypothetical protein
MDDGRFQFGLRSALAVISACCILFAVIGAYGVVPLVVLAVPIFALVFVCGLACIVLDRLRPSESTIVHAVVAALVFIAAAAWIVLVFGNPV